MKVLKLGVLNIISLSVVWGSHDNENVSYLLGCDLMLYSVDRSDTFLQNAGNHLQDYTA
jgi:hypothetical protein